MPAARGHAGSLVGDAAFFDRGGIPTPVEALCILQTGRSVWRTMALPTAQEAAAKWSSRASAASQDYVAGAQRTDKDPTALAIAAGPRYLQQVQAAYQSGKYAAGLGRAGRDGWLRGITSKGATNYSTGVNAAQA